KDLYRSILEGCSFGLKQIFDIIETEYKIQQLSIQSIGGGSKNRAWAQIKASVFNKRFEIKDIPETAVLGACLIAGKAVGYFKSYEEAAKKVHNKTIDWVEPLDEQIEDYQRLYQIYCELYPALRSFYSLSNEWNLTRKEVSC
ncbi:MAG TPA: FGGY-family carbohydrate kinase, partial [Chondromyces sp.]|nr:FGGY-family carbohydrate kinase [Chondromyces sp.]